MLEGGRRRYHADSLVALAIIVACVVAFVALVLVFGWGWQ
jgi:hypothetical protein